MPRIFIDFEVLRGGTSPSLWCLLFPHRKPLSHIDSYLNVRGIALETTLNYELPSP